jgi:D-cysteine desulfhydrase family pyridoxal phosphate-dependent enzyme
VAERGFVALTRVALATLPTPLEFGGELPSGALLWVKRDDLTGLGAGGNKARKLEYLCGEALERDADCLVTVGAAQSNHCRMTAAAGARLGLEVHLVLSGDKPPRLTGNQLLADLFGAKLHHTGVSSFDWPALESFRAARTQQLIDEGRKPHSIPIGGSTPVGALGYVDAYGEIMRQCADDDIEPAAIVFTSSSGGTHAGLVAGLAIARASNLPCPRVIAIGVAKGPALNVDSVRKIAEATLELLGSDAKISGADVVIDDRFIGENYAVPTVAGAEATKWAAHRGAWILDSVYTAKGFSGLLGRDAEGEWSNSQQVIFVHTGGLPSVFA